MIFELTTIAVIPFSIAFIALLVASYTDLKTREVPDWLNFSLVAAGFGINALFSVSEQDAQYIVASLVGFGIFFAFGWVMFYTGQWGGGDSKMLMGLGALFGINVFVNEIPFMAHFLVNILIVGAVYGLLWSFFLVIMNQKNFRKAVKKINVHKNVVIAKRVVLITSSLLVASTLITKDSYGKLMLIYAALLLVVTFYLWIAVRGVEKACMLKLVIPQHLTEGDWIAKEVRINGAYITGPKDLGIEKKQIKKLIELYKKKKVKKILIKEGIPFVPSFFIAFIVTSLVGNIVLLIF